MVRAKPWALRPAAFASRRAVTFTLPSAATPGGRPFDGIVVSFVVPLVVAVVSFVVGALVAFAFVGVLVVPD